MHIEKWVWDVRAGVEGYFDDGDLGQVDHTVRQTAAEFNAMRERDERAYWEQQRGRT